MNEILEKLLKMEVSKYAIAKACGVKWNTVNMWSKDAFQPVELHIDCLWNLYIKLTTKDEVKVDEGIAEVRYAGRSQVLDSKRYPKETKKAMDKIHSQK